MLPDFTPVEENVAYSYIRFSHPDQAKGDSVRRQTEAALQWCSRNKARLDTSITLHDLGKSAYTGQHRKNPDRHALAAFLRLVEQGKIPRGAFLIVESLDRLTREHIRPALTLLLNLIEAGVRIVQLKPVEVIYDEDVEPMQLMMALMELSRGNSESAMKSERVGSAWKEKKRQAAENGKPVTARTPCWLRLIDGKFKVDEQAKRAIRSIFRWAIDGCGIGVITKKLNAEEVPPIGYGSRASDKWARSYVAKILDNRAVVGEYQPYKGRAGARRKDGDPIPGYYPVVITEDEWNAAKAALASRRGKAGRPAKHGVNLWTGLLRCARDGGTIHVMDKGPRSGVLLVPYNATQGVKGSVMASFPFVTFEDAVLELLREIDSREILEGANGHDEVMALEGEHGQLEAAIASISAELDARGESVALYARLRAKEIRLGEVAKLLREARQKAANPLSAAWGEAKNLAKLAKKARERGDTDMLLRLRAALRRIVDSIWLLVVPRGQDRLAAVQIWFQGGGNHRDYLILHRPAKGNRHKSKPAGRWCDSLDPEDATDLDLRRPGKAAALEKELTAWDYRDWLTEERRF